MSMTNSNGNNSDRLERIERILDRLAQRDEITAIRIERLSLRTEENERNIQALNQATQTMIRQMDADRLQREEEKAEHQLRMRELEGIQKTMAQTQAGLTRLLAAMDEERPTILRRLMAIENKVDTLIERER